MNAFGVLAIFRFAALDLTAVYFAALVFATGFITTEFLSEIIGFIAFGLLRGAFTGAFLRHNFLTRRTRILMAILFAVMNFTSQQFSAFLATHRNRIETRRSIIASEGRERDFFTGTG